MLMYELCEVNIFRFVCYEFYVKQKKSERFVYIRFMWSKYANDLFVHEFYVK